MAWQAFEKDTLRPTRRSSQKQSEQRLKPVPVEPFVLAVQQAFGPEASPQAVEFTEGASAASQPAPAGSTIEEPDPLFTIEDEDLKAQFVAAGEYLSSDGDDASSTGSDS